MCTSVWHAPVPHDPMTAAFMPPVAIIVIVPSLAADALLLPSLAMLGGVQDSYAVPHSLMVLLSQGFVLARSSAAGRWDPGDVRMP